MMDLLPPVGWADVARQSSVDAQFVSLRGEMAQVRGEMAELRAELKGEIGELRAEFKVLEGKVDRQVRQLAAINALAVVGASISTAGLVLAAAHFA